MKRILLLFLGKTGAGPVYTYEMARELSKNAQIFLILSDYIDNKEIWNKEKEKNKNVQIKYIKTYNSKLSFFLSFFNIFQFIRLIRTINKCNPDLLYSTWVHYWDPLIYPFLKCKIKIKTIHDPEIKKGEDGLPWQLLHYFSFRYADKYVILSKIFKQGLIKKGIDKNDIIVIPHAGFSYYKNKEENNKYIFHNTILFFGRIVEYKGLDVLLSAMKIVVRSIPQIKLIIAGDGDISKNEKDLQLLKNNVDIYNQWISNNDVEKYFRLADISVLPYIEATQSGIIPLSYSFSKPVIASAVGAISEQVLEGETGYLVAPANSLILAEMIIRIMNSPSLIKEMSRKCHCYYESCMTWESSAKKILSLL
jgi:glycosyltransferase involved in cell wall biosynthesis